MKKFKLIFVLGAALALALFALAGCGSSSSSSSASTAASGSASASASGSAEAKFTLVLGFDAGFKPYGYIDDDGNYTGVDIDLAKEVCERNGWELQLEPIDWDAKDALINAGTITCIWNGFTITDVRRENYEFTEPYMRNAQVVVVKAGSEVTTLSDLAGKHVMTQTESAGLELLTDEEDDYAEIAKTFAGGQPETLGDYNNIFMQLESGAVDAVVCDLSVAMDHMAAKPDAFVIVEELNAESFGVGFKKGETELAQTVNDTLRAMYEDGTVEKILANYETVSLENWLLK